MALKLDPPLEIGCITLSFPGATEEPAPESEVLMSLADSVSGSKPCHGSAHLPSRSSAAIHSDFNKIGNLLVLNHRGI